MNLTDFLGRELCCKGQGNVLFSMSVPGKVKHRGTATVAGNLCWTSENRK